MADIGKKVLDTGWLAARSTEVVLTGVQITTTHPPSRGTSPWMDAVVPGTVLATLVKNKLVPDPFYGLENEAILDIADSGREYYTFWFFTTFNFELAGNQHMDLNLRGINYSADVYLNGHKMALPKGMFRRHSLGVTDILNPHGQNLLAVLVHPPDHPGKIPPQGGQGGDHEIGKDVATQYVEGWDWMAPVRDRNTGIWDEVSISVTGPVKIIDPHLVSTYFDNYKRVYLHTTTELENRSDQLFFYKPNLWWPNGMGKQSLYHVDITVDVKGFGESDIWTHLYGFRKIESHIDKVTGGRLFKVNGQPVFIRGGNWICSDGLLRLSKKRYQTDIKFHAEMNFNMLRCWGGGLAERPDFYHFCDRYGLLVWQEFWITGDVDGRGDPVSNPDGPLDHDLFLLCARDTIKLLRNHPSLALWVGGNEKTPPDDLNKALKDYLKLHPHFESCRDTPKSNEGDRLASDKDPSQYLDGTRVYVQGSMWDGFADGKGGWSDGPYEIQNPEDFFRDGYYKYGFNPEVGSVGMPVAATIRATMPPEGWQIPLFKKLENGYIEEVSNPIWKYHKYIPYSKPNKVHDQILKYGTTNDLDDFCLKTQNPWTGLRGQFYDHLHDQTAGFYGCRLAAEPIHVVNTTAEQLSDVAIEVSVWDLHSECPFYKVHENLSAPPKKTTSIAEMKYPKSKNPKPVYFLLLKLYKRSDYGILSRNFYWLHLPGGDYKLLEPYRSKKIPLKITSNVTITGSTYQLQMQVANTSKKPNQKDNSLCKNNLYQRYGEEEEEDNIYSAETHPGFFKRVYKQITRGKDGLRVFEMNGEDSGVAFFLHFSVHKSTKEHKEGEDTRILPVHYSDNYFSLVPGEVMPVSITFEVPDGVTPRVTLNGWNYHGGHMVI
ncbi:hypothetical protein V2J09_001043 [Rumex salicifolius]